MNPDTKAIGLAFIGTIILSIVFAIDIYHYKGALKYLVYAMIIIIGIYMIKNMKVFEESIYNMQRYWSEKWKSR